MKKYILIIAFLIPLTVFTQNTVFTYQGRVTDNGTNFNGSGQFQFALVTSTNANHTATATANAPSGGFISGYTLTAGGNGYAIAPTVTISGGGGSGASAHTTISGGIVTGITVDSSGNGGYITAPTVTIAAPPASFSYKTYWSNDGTSTSGSEPSAFLLVGVTTGLFNVALGDTNVSGMSAVSATLFQQPNLQLRIWFNDGTHGFAVLDPVQNLTTTPYAATAVSANQLVNGLTVQNNSSGAPNVIGGSSVNYIASGVVGATIGGGGSVNYYNGGMFINSVMGDFGTVSGGYDNTVGGKGATVGGGYNNTADDTSATVSGGDNNTATLGATAGGGEYNTANGVFSTAGGGYQNTANGYLATVSGGGSNSAGNRGSTVGGGEGNIASGNEATVSGGDDNTGSGLGATVGGGYYNIASGNYSYAAGANAHATNDGSFVWNDSTGSNFSSTANNQFAVHASGGIRLAGDVQLDSSAYHHLSLTGGNALGYLYGSFPALNDGVHLGYNYYYDASGAGHVSNTGGATSRLSVGYGFVGIYVGGVNAAPGTQRLLANSTGVTVNGTFNNSSDRNVKQDFAPVSPAQMLERVARLPISEWSYQEDPTTRHVGPMGQDFYSTFNIGTDEKHIAPIDEGGVALAAIQGLNQKLETKSNELEVRSQKLELENAELKNELNELKQMITSKIGGKP